MASRSEGSVKETTETEANNEDEKTETNEGEIGEGVDTQDANEENEIGEGINTQDANNEGVNTHDENDEGQIGEGVDTQDANEEDEIGEGIDTQDANNEGEIGKGVETQDANDEGEIGEDANIRDGSIVAEEEKSIVQNKISKETLLEDTGIEEDQRLSIGSKASIAAVDESVVQELDVRSSKEDDVENISSMKESKEAIIIIEDSGFQEMEDYSKVESEKTIKITGRSSKDEGTEVVSSLGDGLVSQKDSRVAKTKTDYSQRTELSFINKTDEDEMTERVITLEATIDSPITDHRSYSTTSKTDSDAYDRSVRMVNTQTQNTPNQEVVTVKFVASPNVTFAHAFNLSSTIQDIKKQVSELIKIDANVIKLSKDGYDVDNWLPLAGLGVEMFGCIELNIMSTDPTQQIIIIDENIPTVDVITVHVLQDDGSFKDIIVEIHDEAYCKQWLGGFRNRKTNVEFHHANTQTLPRFRNVRRQLDDPPGTYECVLFHRDTQTPYKPKQIAIDTPANKATQMYRSDYMIPTKEDRIITAKEFESYDMWFEKHQVLEKVITIQRCVRNWLKTKNSTSIITIHKQLIQELHDQKLQMLQEQVEKKQQMITGAAFPSKRDDFYMLYLMVGKWWQKEWQRIKELRTEEPKKAEYCALLEKEITLLSAIEKHRIEVKKESLRKQEMRFLEITSRPIVFRNANGGMTSIDDPGTQKAREFKELYGTLTSDELCSQERIEFLLTLKNMMNTYKEYEYVKDITLLIEREINLLVIGIKGKELKGLRKRIEQLFMYFLHQPQFNPKADTYRKPNWPKTVDILYKCTRCSKLLPVSGYPVHTRMEKISVCKSCEWLQNIGHQRMDMSPYLRLLKQIQNSEMQQCCYSSICFVLQQRGAYFLVNTIWHGHSAISECRVLSNLRLVRWIKTIEWSPWNNILLTEEEANCHNSIENVLEFYDQSFIDSVRQKHILARVHFISLLKTDYHLRSTGAWENITDSGPYLHPSHIDAFAKQKNHY